MTSFAQADDFELFTRIRGQFTFTRLSTGVYDCPADFSEMTLCVYSREAFQRSIKLLRQLFDGAPDLGCFHR